MPVSPSKSKAWLDVTLWCNSNGRDLHLRYPRILLCNLRCERGNWLWKPEKSQRTGPPRVFTRTHRGSQSYWRVKRVRDQIERHWTRRVGAITTRTQEHLESKLRMRTAQDIAQEPKWNAEESKRDWLGNGRAQKCGWNRKTTHLEIAELANLTWNEMTHSQSKTEPYYQLWIVFGTTERHGPTMEYNTSSNEAGMGTVPREVKTGTNRKSSATTAVTASRREETLDERERERVEVTTKKQRAARTKQQRPWRQTVNPRKKTWELCHSTSNASDLTRGIAYWILNARTMARKVCARLSSLRMSRAKRLDNAINPHLQWANPRI